MLFMSTPFQTCLFCLLCVLNRMATQRVTRSQKRTELPKTLVTDLDHVRSSPTLTEPIHAKVSANATTSVQSPKADGHTVNVQLLPLNLTRKLTKLSVKDHKLMLLKQQKLGDLDLPRTFRTQDRFVNRSSASRIKQYPADVESKDQALQRVCAATLIFASESAGTAVCIDESGLFLTCAHCVAESEEESRSFMAPGGDLLWLLNSSGVLVQAVCVAWDERRDLALLRVVAAQFESQAHIRFDCVTFASGPLKRQTRIFCVGHPGSEDLEAETAGIATDYPVLAISEGSFLGYAAGQDVQDNSEIGALKHDAWTYWGHSGAPLVSMGDGRLVGLHSSWDDESGTRRGVGIEAIQSFLEEANNNGNVIP